MTPRVSHVDASSSSSPLHIRSRNIHLHSCFYNCYFPNRHTPCPCCWQTSLVGILIQIRTNTGQTSVSPKPALKAIFAEAVASTQLFLRTSQRPAVHLGVCRCIFSCREDQQVYEWKTLIKQVVLTSFRSQNWPLLSLLLDLWHTQSRAREESLDDSEGGGWRWTNGDGSDVTGVNERMRQLHLQGWMDAGMDRKLWWGSGWRAQQGSAHSGFCTMCSSLPQRGLMALMGCQQLSGAFSALQTWELASHITLVPYQVLAAAQPYCLLCGTHRSQECKPGGWRKDETWVEANILQKAPRHC